MRALRESVGTCTNALRRSIAPGVARRLLSSACRASSCLGVFLPRSAGAPRSAPPGQSRARAVRTSIDAEIRLEPRSYFCTCWKLTPRCLASVSWLMRSSWRRIRIRAPTATSIGSAPFINRLLINLANLYLSASKGRDATASSATSLNQAKLSAQSDQGVDRSHSNHASGKTKVLQTEEALNSLAFYRGDGGRVSRNRQPPPMEHGVERAPNKIRQLRRRRARHRRAHGDREPRRARRLRRPRVDRDGRRARRAMAPNPELAATAFRQVSADGGLRDPPTSPAIWRAPAGALR